jgi:uncharacterized membrane protein HdeD (DUF308 family)
MIATLADLHTGHTDRSRLPQRINVTASAAAALAVALAATQDVTAAMDAFAAWAILSGTIQLTVAAHRVGQLRGQWLMIISGAGSIFAGTTFINWSQPPTAALHALVKYSIGGAIRYLLTALWLLTPAIPTPPTARAPGP